MKNSILSLVLSLCFTSLFAQNTAGLVDSEAVKRLVAMEDTLVVYAHGVLRDTSAAKRFISCKELIIGLKNALKEENSFNYSFPKLNAVSIQYPADSSFRIFSWQLYVDENDYRYYGAIQMNTPELKLIPLIDRSQNVTDIEQETLFSGSWYGSLYYNIREVASEEGKYYLLFGFDGYQFFRKRKIIDVLTFEDGEAIFGKPVFVKKEGNGFERTKKRVLMEYSAEVSTRMNYDELMEMIVFDHLIQRSGAHGEGTVNFPDGSYEGYQLEDDGRWMHIDKIFNQVQDEAPRPFPVLENRERTIDIFGNKKKKN